MNKLTVLVVDDEEMDREIVKKFLNGIYEVELAASGKEALEILHNKHIDIMLTDMMMPEMDGLQLLQEVKYNPIWDNVGILVATSYREKTERQALELGADDVISKPYDNIVLRRRIENVRSTKNLSTALQIAKDANKAKTEFLSAMSHDIRTPMNAIIGMTDLALANLNDEQQVNDSLNIIKNSSKHLLQIINDILDMSRIESGKMKLMKSRFSHTKEMANVIERTMALITNKNIHFSHSMSIKHDYCIGDVDRMNRILDNIIGNAVKFTPENGDIELKLEEECTANKNVSNYVFTIRDTGIGMSEETVAQIFDPFFRVNETSVKQIEGTGLGMSIVKNSVELAGGTIDVQSKLGEGSTFIVTLPIEISYAKKINLEEKELYINYNLEGIRVLIVEDHPINQQVAQKLLEKEGVIVTIAENGKVACDLLEGDKISEYDLILMDIRMPVMDGYEAARTIRAFSNEKAKRIPIIAMTANAFSEDIRNCLAAGMNEHVSKPIEAKPLYEIIGKYTGAPLKKTAQPWKQSILVVDDVEINRGVLHATLEDQFHIISAQDGVEALDELKKHDDIIAVITDIQMPRMNGLELIKEIRKLRQYDHIAILANTQYGDVTQEEVLLKAGADDFVYKPTTPTIILTRLRNILKNYVF